MPKKTPATKATAKHAAKKQTAQTTKPGRPRGAKSKKYPLAHGELTRCPRCESTNREPYWFKIRRSFSGIQCDSCPSISQHAGPCPCGGTFSQPFTHVTMRKTKCKTCGQTRNDRTYENAKDDS